jgi:hypothetical protein
MYPRPRLDQNLGVVLGGNIEYSITELMRLTRTELCTLFNRIGGACESARKLACASRGGY